MFHDFTKAINRKLWWHKNRPLIAALILCTVLFELPNPFPWWMRFLNWAASWADTTSSGDGYGGGGGGGF